MLLAQPMPDRPENIPPGWEYNPATWSQRLPIVILALGGMVIATYLSLYQYNVINEVWDPFFTGPPGEENGTEKILSSRLSYPFRAVGMVNMPILITDAALGAFAYLLDAVAGLIGGRKRWRTMPWIVVLFAILVGPLGLVSIGLVIAQPVVEGHWCTLCLASAAVSMLMIGPAMDEALASLQYMKRVHADPNRSFWKAFWGIEENGRIHFW